MSCLLLPIAVIALSHLMFVLSGLHCVRNFLYVPYEDISLYHLYGCFMTFVDNILSARYVPQVELIKITLKIFLLYSASTK